MAILERTDWTAIAVALGSNLGNRVKHLQQAIAQLAALSSIRRLQVSPVYQTPPVGPPQPDYYNACAIAETCLAPHDLLQQLQAIEAAAGRERLQHWGPRTLDLDLLLYGDRQIQTPDLTVPHPYLTQRAFVLIPLAAIAPDWVEPVTGEAIATLAQRLDSTGIERLGSMEALAESP
ncbi:2-amino-4-hydroxy-6-hydroxymethyldihydropteridine diphosphokinase [Synechococcus elongatus]|uniref:2-amino-4-hydroxy-6-hydroxymethyldihydropteridine diphosphokinase n=2 Tax=Synechococcus elongatus TaxID=32046 RepID=Q31KW7_SYNE7|nr:2-amino-4-hydroxy-6-hydroxymethyldihydropteridine diphosphokinase [Synechococcus elongatus]MBD2688097.1 2-amino-4-hydroxy-6-hydroxymethyldihydropteridine diphosphokinase [Synechococcus elongatus FACHB-1061]ABB58302.1 2-amino-4-hydroxy-6-hydroxymethyldihydropteridine pyrophosphokinase [Synechococcus elongatus PCC 7942 = FACHB-805]AJD57230.1 2-amino-4-hydroxy-6-hydroxymethyldihydropteridine pyrophosphokinase [Synechococcus elongatus UTEX 2973]MBD2587026.1 2-amino-4-hydroxy-6-hydroxymethyldihyd